jgi:outer membrane protein OmpA-like peptidoglycan-associated protein
MAANLIDLAKNILSSEITHRISSELGENPEHVEKAIGAGIPAILAGLLKMLSTSGANRLSDMLKHDPSELSSMGGLDGVLGNLGRAFGGGSVNSLIAYGQTLLRSLFGGQLSSIVDVITKSSGIKESSAGSLLGMLAPLLMGLLRKETAAKGFSAASLTDLLMGQKDAIAKLAPAGLTSALGLKSLNELGSAVDSIKLAGAGAARDAGRAMAGAARQGNEWLRWAAPLALLAAVALGLYFWYGGQGAPQNPEQPANLAQANRAVADTARTAANRVAQGLSDAGKAVTTEGKALIETAGRMIPLSLPGNITLDVPENSYLRAMVKFFTDGAGAGAREAKTFVADNFNFEGATASLSPDSSTAASSLATIMKAFSTATLKIEGHTDNVGDLAQNKKISLERATAVKDALVKAGVPADRITVEGVGPDRPVASNDTEQGRAKNRRIELAVVSR